MVKHLFIAGHGYLPNGGFDPGATGYITKGEWRYYKEHFIPAMKKFIGHRKDVAFYADKSVYAYQNLVSLVQAHGGVNNVIVHELHYDALGNSSASGGHVIVHADFVPDQIDLAIRDVIKKYIGVRYNHRGHSGISGRRDLLNVNIARNAGINYRLIELGFGTNKRDADIMMKYVESIAKDYCIALFGQKGISGKGTSTGQVPDKKPDNQKLSQFSDSQLAEKVMQGEFGNGETRKQALGSRYGSVQKIVDDKMGRGKEKSIQQLVREVLAGKHGNGADRVKSLGSRYYEVQQQVNRQLQGGHVDQIVTDVINGKFGNYPERRDRLYALGYDYEDIQRRVNKRLRK